MWSSFFFLGISHAFVRVTAVTRDCLVRNSGFEAQIIADLRAILGVLPGQRYRGASGGLIAFEGNVTCVVEALKRTRCLGFSSA
jgi:hypothetical protein